ncbi:hypothetical protein ACIF9R_02910 [Streptomyces sp. NPDC086080]|uniref:hypothetical protein n=1 Tax=Streptomyces sp. NPDC086080 TaxID=3365748 RepID=UPI0037D1E915
MPRTRLLSFDDLAALRSGVAGPVFVPGDPGLGEELADCRTAVLHHPVAVVGAMCPQDVVSTVRWAAALGLPVTVQRTGQGPVEQDGGLLVTTGRMRPAPRVRYAGRPGGPGPDAGPSGAGDRHLAALTGTSRSSSAAEDRGTPDAACPSRVGPVTFPADSKPVGRS